MSTQPTQQYTEVKRKAIAGERIKIVDRMLLSDPYNNGDELIVIKRLDSQRINVIVNGSCAIVRDEEYVVLEPVTPAPPQQLDFSEALALFMRENAAAIRKYLDEIETETAQPVTQSKPLSRAEEKPDRAAIIAKAKADVAELLRIGGDVFSYLPAGTPFYNRVYNVEFHVNREKRAVTALVRRGRSLARKPDAKATAKCAPDDVFHAEIGKAISLRKALGLTVPDEYINAPQPDEPRVGAIVQAYLKAGRKQPMYPIKVAKVTEERGVTKMHRDAQSYLYTPYEPDETGDYILDDSDVDYGAVDAAAIGEIAGMVHEIKRELGAVV